MIKKKSLLYTYTFMNSYLLLFNFDMCLEERERERERDINLYKFLDLSKSSLINRICMHLNTFFFYLFIYLQHTHKKYLSIFTIVII